MSNTCTSTRSSTGYVERAVGWRHSMIHRYVKQGILLQDWAVRPRKGNSVKSKVLSPECASLLPGYTCWLNAVVAGVLNATGVIGKLSTAVGEKIPGINKLFYAPNPRIAALLQAPALAPGVTRLAEEMLAMPGNVVTGAMTDKLGRMIFGSGKQDLGTFVVGNPGGAFGSDPFGMDLRRVK